jgi:hypothetical protein
MRRGQPIRATGRDLPPPVKGPLTMTDQNIDACIARRDMLDASLIETERELDALNDEKAEQYAKLYAENVRLWESVEDYNDVIWKAPIASLRHLIDKIAIMLRWIETGLEPADLLVTLSAQLQSGAIDLV